MKTPGPQCGIKEKLSWKVEKWTILIIVERQFAFLAGDRCEDVSQAGKCELIEGKEVDF
ncbi:MAG TPA: hypothetical protein VMW91_11685 [Desulfosporosinus sp.]|nr:hypothetical protein [Desulfosporosinus sp.]